MKRVVLIFLFLACSRTQQRHQTVVVEERKTWDNRAVTVAEKQQQTATETKRVTKRTTRTIVKKPDGTVSDTTVVEDSTVDQAGRSDSAEKASHSEQATAAVEKKSHEIVNTKNESKPASPAIPWKLWAVVFLFFVIFVGTLLWRKGRLRLPF